MFETHTHRHTHKLGKQIRARGRSKASQHICGGQKFTSTGLWRAGATPWEGGIGGLWGNLRLLVGRAGLQPPPPEPTPTSGSRVGFFWLVFGESGVFS